MDTHRNAVVFIVPDSEVGCAPRIPEYPSRRGFASLVEAVQTEPPDLRATQLTC